MSKTRTITPNPPADFVPSKNDVSYLRPFRVWCQKVLPLVYDDSLSYYELLCKVVGYLNKTMEEVNQLGVDVSNLFNAFQQLQDYVNHYFDTLDVQQEINNKLDELVASGRIDVLLNAFIFYVTPEMFGAKGDGVTDDTDAFLSALNTGKQIRLSAKTYLINFSDFNLTNVEIIGSNKDKSIILNNKSASTFGTVGINTLLSNFKLISNTECNILTFSGQLTNFTIEHLNITGSSGCIAMMFDITVGTTGGLINDIRVQNCDYAMYLKIDHFLTALIVNNCNFNSFYKSGVFITGDSLFSHSEFNNCNFYCNHDGVNGFEFSINYGIALNNCNVFNDNSEGMAYSVKLYYPNNLTEYKIVRINGGIYEGLIDSTLMNGCIISRDTLFVVRPYNGALTENIRQYANNKLLMKYYPNIHLLNQNITTLNVNISYDVDEYGWYMKLTNSSDSAGYLRVTNAFKYGEIISCYLVSDTFLNFAQFDDGTQSPISNRVIAHDNVYYGTIFGTPKADGIANNIQLNVDANTSIKIYKMSVCSGLSLHYMDTPVKDKYYITITKNADENGVVDLSDYNPISISRITNEKSTAIMSTRPNGNVIAIIDTPSISVTLNLLMCDFIPK